MLVAQLLPRIDEDDGWHASGGERGREIRNRMKVGGMQRLPRGAENAFERIAVFGIGAPIDALGFERIEEVRRAEGRHSAAGAGDVNGCPEKEVVAIGESRP